MTAVDLTENALRVAKEFAARRDVSIDFRLGNAEGLEFPDGEFDCCLLIRGATPYARYQTLNRRGATRAPPGRHIARNTSVAEGILTRTVTLSPSRVTIGW